MNERLSCTVGEHVGKDVTLLKILNGVSNTYNPLDLCSWHLQR